MLTAEEKRTVLEYLRSQRLAVVSSVSASGAPQAALVGVAVTDALEIVFDTTTVTRKHANLLRDKRAAVTFSGPGEQTLQLQGEAHAVSVDGSGDAPYRETYFQNWPSGRDRLAWANLTYWRIVPEWIRYSDYEKGPLIMERTLR